mmetsp:Transcript_15533/g.23504  ORF Transcript_15533/g.23504 Transcript_15533/m.23504 type:complete len:241 (+) Transcript_15533:101-823(+)
MCSTAAFTVTTSSDPQPRWLASSCSNALVLIRSSRNPNSCSCFNSVSHLASTTAEMGSTDVTDLSDSSSLISSALFLVSTISFSSVTTLQSSSVLLCSSVLSPSSSATLAAEASVWAEAVTLLNSSEFLSASAMDEATEKASAAAAAAASATSLEDFCTASSSMASSIACTQTSSVLPMTSAMLFPSASEKKESSLLSLDPDLCAVLIDSSSSSGLEASAGVPSLGPCSSDLGLAASLKP